MIRFNVKPLSIWLLGGGFACSLTAALGQSFEESLLFAAPGIEGGPRYVAMGGAFHALGGEMSSIADNPAGAAVFLHGRLDVALGITGSQTESNYWNRSLSSSETDLALPLIGINTSFDWGSDAQKKWFFGFVLKRELGFDQSIEIEGVNPNSSIIDAWIDQSNGTPPDFLLNQGLLYERMGWETYLTDVADSASWGYTSFATGLDLNQRYSETRSGQRSLLQFHLAGSHDHRWFYGVGIGIPLLTYRQQWRYAESGFDGNSLVDRFDLTEEYQLDAVGFNLNVGVIYRPVEAFRVSASYRSPSWYASNAAFVTDLETVFRDGGPNAATSYFNEQIEYALTSPQKFGLGLAYVFKDRGLLSFGYEATDPSNLKVRGKGFSLEGLEQNLSNQLQWTQQFRMGGEILLGHWSLRGGYAYTQSTDQIVDRSLRAYSMGVGYDFGGSWIDFGWSIQRGSGQLELYNPTYTPPAELEQQRQGFVLGAGLAF